MAIVYSEVLPQDGDINVDLNTEIVIKAVDSVPITISNINVTIAINEIPATDIILNGVFVNGWSGEYITITPPGDGSELYIVITQTDSSPTMGEGAFSIVTAGALIVNFGLLSYKLTFPAYTEIVDISAIPGAGWTNQFAGTGSAPSFGGGFLTTNPGAAGSSYIQKTAYGLDFANGFLIDIFISGNGVTQSFKLIEVFKGGEGLVSVVLDWANDEVRLNDVVGIPLQGFNPILYAQAALEIRLSVKGVGNDLIARLYIDDIVTYEGVLLKQTLGPSTSLGTVEDYISVGSIDVGDGPVAIIANLIRNGLDPDDHYAFYSINSVTPLINEVGGGNKITSILNREIDTSLGSYDFSSLNKIVDTSTGVGNISVVSNKLRMELVAGIGEASAKLTHSYSGDLPSGTAISLDVEADATLVTTPPQSDVVLAGIEFKADGMTAILELISGLVNGVRFRLLLTNQTGTILDRDVLSVTSASHSIKILRFGNQLIFSIDNQEISPLGISDGVGLLRLYLISTTAISAVTNFANLSSKPVFAIGSKLVETTSEGITKIISSVIPTGDNVGDFPIILSGLSGDDTFSSQFTYTAPIQEVTIAEATDLSLNVVDNIVKEPL